MTETNDISNAQWLGFEKQLRTYVRGRVDPEWVDDLVGNILLRLVQNKDRLGDADNPAAYVQSICTNAVTDFYRRRSSERRALADIAAEKSGTNAVDAQQNNTAQSDISQCMFPFIKELPAPYRDALTLTEIEQLTQRQAAEQLGLSLSGMKSRVQRGRALLKQAVTRCCSVELDRRGRVVDYDRRPNRNGKSC